MRWMKSVVVIASLAAGSAWAQVTDEEMGIGQPPEEETVDPFATPPEETIIVTEEEESVELRERNDMQGLTVMGGGGVEGYTGDFAPNINPGLGWGVTANLKPWKALGLELGYSGAINELDHDRLNSNEGAANGADIVRNGGHAAVIAGLPTPIQPYLMGGIGIDRYTFRGADGEAGFQDDTSGSVPLGIGVRAHTGRFTADLRAGYDLLFDDDFSPVQDATVTNGRYTGMLQIGGTF